MLMPPPLLVIILPELSSTSIVLVHIVAYNSLQWEKEEISILTCSTVNKAQQSIEIRARVALLSLGLIIFKSADIHPSFHQPSSCIIRCSVMQLLCTCRNKLVYKLHYMFLHCKQQKKSAKFHAQFHPSYPEVIQGMHTIHASNREVCKSD